MSRYTDPVCKLCRREGKKSCSLRASAATRTSAPWSAVPMRRASTARAGRKLPNMASSCVPSSRPAVTTAFRRASSVNISRWRSVVRGVTGENLLRICESRLDNVVYLLGWARLVRKAVSS